MKRGRAELEEKKGKGGENEKEENTEATPPSSASENPSESVATKKPRCDQEEIIETILASTRLPVSLCSLIIVEYLPRCDDCSSLNYRKIRCPHRNCPNERYHCRVCLYKPSNRCSFCSKPTCSECRKKRCGCNKSPICDRCVTVTAVECGSCREVHYDINCSGEDRECYGTIDEAMTNCQQCGDRVCAITCSAGYYDHCYLSCKDCDEFYNEHPEEEDPREDLYMCRPCEKEHRRSADCVANQTIESENENDEEQSDENDDESGDANEEGEDEKQTSGSKME